MTLRGASAVLVVIAFATVTFNQEVPPIPLNQCITQEMEKPVPPSVAFNDIVGRVGCTPFVDNCEACIDQFYAAYAAVLASIVDQRYPHVRCFHRDLRTAFLEVEESMCVAGGPGTYQIHEPARLPARLEWAIYQGEKNHYASPLAKRYFLRDIRSGCLHPEAMSLTKSEQRQMAEHCRTAMLHFKAALRCMKEPVQQYYIELAVNGFHDM